MAAQNPMQSVASFVRGDSGDPGSPPPSYEDMLFAIRSHLGLDIAFISEFTGGRRIFRHVNSHLDDQPVRVGTGHPLEESFCQRVVDGRLPELIPDAAAMPAALELPVTRALPIGAHLSVPIRLKDGRIYGTFCCFSFTPNHSLNPRDLIMMRVFADLAAKQIDRDMGLADQRNAMVGCIEAVLAGNDPSMVYQPIYDLERGEVAGFESLARFSASPQRTPDLWFGDAARINRSVELEIKAIRKALSGFNPDAPNVYVSVNVSAETILSGKLAAALNAKPLDSVVLEITEHVSVVRYEEIARALSALRSRGLRLAVDDAGAEYASFRHILALRPDLIKLDMSLTRDVDRDGAKRALALALVTFAHETASEIIAEGVETAGELNALRALGVAYAQGYVLGRPAASLAIATANQDLFPKKSRALLNG